MFTIQTYKTQQGKAGGLSDRALWVAEVIGTPAKYTCLIGRVVIGRDRNGAYRKLRDLIIGLTGWSDR